MKKHNKLSKIFKNEKEISQVFLGIGLTLFLLNISSFLTYNPSKYSIYSFDLSIFSSIIIIIYSTYIINKNEKKN